MAITSGLDEKIAAGESVARFLRQSNYVAKTSGRIKHVAFLPAPDDDTSTFRVDGLAQEELWGIAVRHVVGRAKNGAARFQAGVVAEAGLKIEAKEPPERHANIRGWSMDKDPEMRKSKRKTAAMILAEESYWDNWSAMPVRGESRGLLSNNLGLKSQPLSVNVEGTLVPLLFVFRKQGDGSPFDLPPDYRYNSTARANGFESPYAPTRWNSMSVAVSLCKRLTATLKKFDPNRPPFLALRDNHENSVSK